MGKSWCRCWGATTGGESSVLIRRGESHYSPPAGLTYVNTTLPLGKLARDISFFDRSLMRFHAQARKALPLQPLELDRIG
jgi:hypothetical protein